MNSYRTLAVAALAFSAFAAQADSAVPRDGDWNSYPLTSQTHSSLTREAVVADLVLLGCRSFPRTSAPGSLSW